ncbi:HNH endonuclease signature motif containing protein [Paenirhodobacter populi]
MCGNTAEHVDHIKPHRGDQALFWDWRNLQALCAHCHNSVKQRQERANVRT